MTLTTALLLSANNHAWHPHDKPRIDIVVNAARKYRNALTPEGVERATIAMAELHRDRKFEKSKGNPFVYEIYAKAALTAALEPQPEQEGES